ncbi:MAG: tRNA uridine-5-carboxymethylaminomethyl(34) synthesis GTPase MnmE [Pseudomonadota bacterium]
MDTIYALASAQGKAGVAVVRISGPHARATASRLTGRVSHGRGMSLAVLRDDRGGTLDHALVLNFPGPHSFTGEDVVELHLHGSPAIVASVLDRLGQSPGLRLADPGEFTRRALENGKMDLAQVEGLADLIDAETEAQRQQAQRVFAGDFGALVARWRADLIRAAALIEATIDFADEEVPTDVTPEVSTLLAGVMTDIKHQTDGVAMAERIRAGFEVAILGRPNVGKSTLLNALAGRKAAITSDIAGTTRDVIEVRMDLRGLPVTLLDTAGLRETDDVIEGLGVDLAKERAKAADLRVFLADPEDIADLPVQPRDIVVHPKADLRSDMTGAVSGITGAGLDTLVNRIGDVLTNMSATAGLATRARHAQAMHRAQTALAAAQSVLDAGPDQYDIAAEELRSAIRALESLVGHVDVENLLDEIFSSFCVGK